MPKTVEVNREVSKLDFPKDHNGHTIKFGTFVCPEGRSFVDNVNLAEPVKEIRFYKNGNGRISAGKNNRSQYVFRDGVVNDAFVLTFEYMMNWLKKCSNREEEISAKGTEMTVKDFAELEILTISIRKASTIISTIALFGE